MGNEVFRQRDKANNNDIGYFHQRIFQYIRHCRVPENGKEGGWDVIYHRDEGIVLPGGDTGRRVHQDGEGDGSKVSYQNRTGGYHYETEESEYGNVG